MDHRAAHYLTFIHNFIYYLLCLRHDLFLLLYPVYLGHYKSERLGVFGQKLHEHRIARQEAHLQIYQQEDALQAARLLEVEMHEFAPSFHFRLARPGVPVARTVHEAAIWLLQRDEGQVLRLAWCLRGLRLLDA